MNSPNKQTTPFKKGDIIIKAEAVYPHGALVVVGYDDQNQLLAHPKGGGLQYVFNPAAQRQFRHVTEEEMQEPLWRTTRFCLEGIDGNFKGWTDGHLWNGWERPHFEFEEAQKLMASLIDSKINYDPARDAFITQNGEGEEDIWPAQLITALGQTQVKVYPIGAGSWCWEEVTNERP